MKQLTQLLCILFFVQASVSYAQEFQGIATYKSKTSNKSLKIDSTMVQDPVLQKKIQEMVSKKFEKTYELSFNKEVTIYKQKKEDNLDKPTMGQDGIIINIIDDNSNDVLYINLKDQKYIEEKSISGKMFLIKDSIKKKDWQLESDTKTIGEYTCYKAIFKTKKAKITINGKLENDDEKDKYQIVTAWYTPQIPVNSGPGNYYGLPGLILEVNDGIRTIICSEIVLNPKTEIDFSEPTKGKDISAIEFNALNMKKLKELQRRTNGTMKIGG